MSGVTPTPPELRDFVGKHHQLKSLKSLALTTLVSLEKIIPRGGHISLHALDGAKWTGVPVVTTHYNQGCYGGHWDTNMSFAGAWVEIEHGNATLSGVISVELSSKYQIKYSDEQAITKIRDILDSSRRKLIELYSDVDKIKEEKEALEKQKKIDEEKEALEKQKKIDEEKEALEKQKKINEEKQKKIKELEAEEKSLRKKENEQAITEIQDMLDSCRRRRAELFSKIEKIVEDKAIEEEQKQIKILSAEIREIESRTEKLRQQIEDLSN